MTPQPARPTALDINPAGIPQALKDRAQWVCWDYALVQARWTKRPLNAHTGVLASATDPATWAPFVVALAARDRHGYAGIGYVFSPDDGLTGVDVDHCRGAVDGELTIYAQTIADELNSYTEVTPSGTGLHIIVQAALPDGKGRKSSKHGIEVYDRARFFTVTGARLPEWPAEPQERQQAFDDLYGHLFPLRSVSESESGPRPAPSPPPPDDTLLIDRAHRAKNGGIFARLWRGDTSGNHDDDSSADLALCNLLAFWCGDDPARIDRLFRQSGLYRTKWERESYRQATIAKALEGRTEYYDWAERGAPTGAATFRLVDDEGQDDDQPPPNDGGGGAPSTNPNDYAQTDTGNGELFAALYADQLRYDHRRAMWHQWAGHWWQGDSNRQARFLTKEIARVRQRAAAELGDDQRKAALAWAKTSASKAKRDALLSHASDEPQLAATGTDWDTDPYLLGVANGVVDLRTGVLHEGTPRDYVTLHSPVAFDSEATAPRWERYLREVFRDDVGLVAWIQRMIGYSLTGDIGEHAVVVCFGTGSNGKSTLFTILDYLLGDYGGTMSFSALAHGPYEAHPTELASLVGRRFVTASELNEGQRLNEARIKALSGGDMITARFMRQDEFRFRPQMKLWLSVNHKPVVKDDSRGFWRRLRLLPFLREFPVDKTLEGQLRAEAPGILAWAVRGCLDWQRQGLGTAEAISAATAEYQEDSDPLVAFLAECCNQSESLVVQANVLYRTYQEWATEQGQREKEQLSSTTFGRRVSERFTKQRTMTGNIYKGVALKPAWAERQRGARFTP